MKAFLPLAALVMTSPALAQEQVDPIGSLFKALIGKKPTDSSAGASAVAGRGAFMATMSAEQRAALDASLSAKMPNADLQRDISEARPLIDKLVTIGACATSLAAWNQINAQSERPETRSHSRWGTAIGESQYHDKRYCFDVQRIGDWSKPAKNALTFKAYFVSALSGEAGSNSFTLIKTPEGQWLVRMAP